MLTVPIVPITMQCNLNLWIDIVHRSSSFTDQSHRTSPFRTDMCSLQCCYCKHDLCYGFLLSRDNWCREQLFVHWPVSKRVNRFQNWSAHFEAGRPALKWVNGCESDRNIYTCITVGQEISVLNREVSFHMRCAKERHAWKQLCMYSRYIPLDVWSVALLV